jgi:hypothetical protein
MRPVLLSVIGLVAVGVGGSLRAQDEPVFSGPQVSEQVPGFEMTAVHGGEAGASVDVVEMAGKNPLLVVFVHERTRPAFGLMNAVARFAETRKEKNLTTAVTMLSADPTETESWLKRVGRNLPKKTLIGFSPDGQEGPGSWGLNRNVAVTIIVANEGKVTANFALVQPSVAQDGPKILKAVVDVTGGGDVPDIARFGNRMRTAAANGPDGNLRNLLRPVINKQATEKEVEKAAAAVEEYVEKHADAKKQIGQISNRIIDAGRLETYGTPKAQEYLKKWAAAFGEKQDKDSDDRKERSVGK